jgi:two-component system sensor histidine kinase QseC
MWSRKSPPLSIHMRLLLFLGVGLAALMMVLFVMLDRSIDRSTHGYLDNALRARAHAIAVLLESRPANEALVQLQAMSPEYAGGGHTDFLQLWDAQGRTLLASDSNDAANLAQPTGVPANEPYFYDLKLPDLHSGRAVALRVTLQGRAGDAILAVAEEREQIDALEHGLHVALTTAAVTTALVAVLLAVLSVRAGLRPLLAFGDTVQRTSETLILPSRQLARELRPLADTLNAAFARLSQALQRERHFAHDVAHELRTPLAEIRTAVELARRDAPASPALDGALASAERMARSIDGLLSLSRYESGLQEVQTEPLDLADLLRHMLGPAERVGTQRGVSFTLGAPAECWVQSDPALLERILDNVLLNAATYAPAGCMVSVQLAQDESRARIVVGNPAPDLAPEDLTRLGERFWRKSPDRTSGDHGGLGLALAHGLARLLGLRLEFSLDAGTLTVTLADLHLLNLPA